jgi:hypothetical protein
LPAPGRPEIYENLSIYLFSHWIIRVGRTIAAQAENTFLKGRVPDELIITESFP